MLRPDFDSDSEDDYDGFTMYSNTQGRIDSRPSNRRSNFLNLNKAKDFESDLVESIRQHELSIFQSLLIKSDLKVNDYLSCSGWTLLIFACHYGAADITEFILKFPECDCNKGAGYKTPIIALLDSRDVKRDDVVKIAKTLLSKGATVNVSNSLGISPLMLACIKGYTEVVELIINIASLEICDNNGQTAIFHAIENNRKEIVELLLKQGADTTVVNGKGYTPRQVAENFGFQDIVDLFPKVELVKTVPLEWGQYSAFPELNKDNEVPEYFQELPPLLYGMHVEHLLPYFAEARATLATFLTLTDDDLKQLGIKYPFDRKCILLGLHIFHLKPFALKAMPKIDVRRHMTTFDYYGFFASHLRQVTVTNSSLKYLLKKDFGDKSRSSSNTMNLDLINLNLRLLDEVHTQLIHLKEKFKIFDQLNPPKPVLFVDDIMNMQMIENNRRIFKWTKFIVVVGSIAIAVKIYMSN